MKLELGGASYDLETAAISAVRYRAAYGDSVVNHLAACKTIRERERCLLRLCHIMIPPDRRPALKTFAAQVRRDGRFFAKALEAKAALLSPDPRRRGGNDGEDGGGRFDEYQVLALMAAAGLGTQLLYELPILHLLAVAGRVFAASNPNRKTYRPMTGEEMAMLYRRR